MRDRSSSRNFKDPLASGMLDKFAHFFSFRLQIFFIYQIIIFSKQYF